MGTVKVSTGIEVYFERHGRGEPLLLISGTGHDHNFWNMQLPFFEREYQCIVFDNRGAGQTTVAPPGYSLADMADDAAGLLTALDIKRAHVMGFSMGGHIAQELCLRHPERVISLGLHHTWARNCPALELFQRARVRALENGDREMLADLSIMGLFAHDYIDAHQEEFRAKRRWVIEGSPTDQGWLGHIYADLDVDTLERLSQISAPTFITASDHDMIVPPHNARDLHQRIKGSRLTIFEGTGHVALMERPEEFARACLEFLRSL